MGGQSMSISENPDNVNVMLIGNNPAEVSGYLSKLSNFKGVRFITTCCFNLRKSFMEIRNWKPHYIVIDDYFPRNQIRKFIRRIRRNVNTQEIPVAILKSSNRSILIKGVQDYLLKDSFTPERLYHAIRNSRNIRKAQVILYMTYKRSKRNFRKIRQFISDIF